MQTSDSTSTSLLIRLKRADPGAWRRFADLYGPLVYDWCRQSGLQPDDAADVAQETFLAVTRSVGSFRHEQPKDSFRGWLWTIAKNKIRDHFRKLQFKAQAQGGTTAHQQLQAIPDPVGEEATHPGGEKLANLERRALETVRAGVEPRTWQAFWEVAVNGRAATDVAEQLGMSRQAVYDANYRIRLRLREELGET